MGSILCKIWRFFSDLLSKVVGFIASAVKTVGSAVVDVLSVLLKEAGSALGNILKANPVVWIALGVGAFMFFKDGDDDDDGDDGDDKPAKRDSTR